MYQNLGNRQHDYVIILYVSTGWYVEDIRALDRRTRTSCAALEHLGGTGPCDIDELRKTLRTVKGVYLNDDTYGTMGYLRPFEAWDIYSYILVIRCLSTRE